MKTGLYIFAQLVHDYLEAQDAYKRGGNIRDLISANFFQTRVEDAIEEILHPVVQAPEKVGMLQRLFMNKKRGIA